MACAQLPTCLRCSQAACSHTPDAPHSIPNACVGYIGYPDCTVCGRPSWDHDKDAPHAIGDSRPACSGYDPGGASLGDGGGFGGGGATGGW